MGGAIVSVPCCGPHASAVRSPARVREQRVLTPLRHVAMVITMVHGLCGVVGGQVVGRRVLGSARPAPLSQWLLGSVRAIDVVTDNAWLGGRGHGHVKDAIVVLRPRMEVLRELQGVVIGYGRHVGDSGLEPTRSSGAAGAGGRGGGLPILVVPAVREVQVNTSDALAARPGPDLLVSHLYGW